jgi:hypothetical protein
MDTNFLNHEWIRLRLACSEINRSVKVVADKLRMHANKGCFSFVSIEVILRSKIINRELSNPTPVRIRNRE